MGTLIWVGRPRNSVEVRWPEFPAGFLFLSWGFCCCVYYSSRLSSCQHMPHVDPETLMVEVHQSYIL